VRHFFISCFLIFLIGFLVIDCSGQHKSAKAGLDSQTEEPLLQENSPIYLINNFHLPMVRIWHFDLPAKDLTAIKEKLPKLGEICQQMKNAVLPPMIAGRRAAYDNAVEELSSTVEELSNAISSGDIKAASFSMENMSEAYERVMRIFVGRPLSVENLHKALFQLYKNAGQNPDLKIVQKELPTLNSLFQNMKFDKDPRIRAIKREEWVKAVLGVEQKLRELESADSTAVRGKILEAYMAFERMDKLFDIYFPS